MKKSTSKKKPTGKVAAPTTTKAAPQKNILNVAALQEALDFMKEHGLSQLEYRAQGLEVALKFRDAGGGAVGTPVMQALVPPPAPAAAAPSAPAPAMTNGGGSKSDKRTITIDSPFVGTFYRSPGPNQDSFVEVGQIIDKGQALCIIEAMKLMNEIESDSKGRIVRVLVDNGTPVEFGEPLFEIEAL